MKKILLSFILGILAGIALLYVVLLVSGKTLTSLVTMDNPASPSQTLVTTPYTHKAEGQQIQHVSSFNAPNIPAQSEAHLYRLKNMCKLVIDIQGQDYIAKRTAYFHKNRLVRMLETEYRTTDDTPPNILTTTSQSIYREILFNPDSQLIQNEFKTLLTALDPAVLKKC